MLAFERVTVRFGETLAVDDLSLACRSGTTTMLLGPSGSGKSTLLRLAVGLLRPTSGRVLLDGESHGDGDLARMRHRIGYVIQEGGLFPHLDVWGNVTLVARYLRWPRMRIEERFAELLELVKLEGALRRRRPDELSGGQRQRVGLMRALMLGPPLLLLDEPLAALDPMVRRALQEDLRELFARLRTTVLMVTHDVAEAAFLGERAVLLRAGRIVQDGPPAELIEAPASDFAREFVAAQRGAREILAERH